MIAINLDFAISLVISIILILVIISWFRYTIKEDRSLNQSKDVVQCPYCSYVFTDFLKQEIKICPRCESYIENKKEEAMKKDIFKNENKATVLITVIMMVLAMTTLSIGILGAMGSQGLLGQNQVNRIQAEQLAKGAFWQFYIRRATTGVSAPLTITETLDGETYTASASTDVPGTGPENTSEITTTTSY